MAVAAKADGKTRLLDAALTVIRTKGYGAATVDDICRAAGLSKGSFFHYFRDKEALAIAAAEHFSAGAAELFAAAAYRDDPDPRERVTTQRHMTTRRRRPILVGTSVSLAKSPLGWIGANGTRGAL